MKDTLSVLIPTLNSRSLLPAHVESIKPCLDIADEIIVVDSDSTDGTVEYLRQKLPDLPVRFLNHPRGLYQSWNHGIQSATGDWIYISTVGDGISADLLMHLREVGRKGNCDVVLSSPRFIDQNGQPLVNFHWAVTEIATTLAHNSPCLISSAAALYYSISHLHTSALLGSCASNLYRTAHLQADPFPAYYGYSGDTAWSMLHAFETTFGCTTQSGSFFRIHEKTYQPEAYDKETLKQRLLSVALSTYEKYSHTPNLRELNIPKMAELIQECVQFDCRLKHLRENSLGPWYLHPHIWEARARTHRARHELKQLRQAATQLVLKHHLKPINSA